MSEEKDGPFLVLSKTTSSWNPTIRIGVWKAEYATVEEARQAIRDCPVSMMHQHHYIGRKSELEQDIEKLAPDPKYREVFEQPLWTEPESKEPADVFKRVVETNGFKVWEPESSDSVDEVEENSAWSFVNTHEYVAAKTIVHPMPFRDLKK